MDIHQRTHQTSTKIHLVRHGEVDNPDGVIYERLPGFGLTDAGQAMAAATAELLAVKDIAFIASSPLARAHETAQPLARLLGQPIQNDDRLIEAKNRLVGQRVSLSLRTLARPSLWRTLHNPFRPSWGERFTEVAARMWAAVESARVIASGREAVLVSHQLPIWVVRRQLEGRKLWHDPRRRECALASVTTLEFLGPRLRAISYTEPVLALAS